MKIESIKSVSGLLIGALLGQGSMLLSQAYLVWRGDSDVVASLAMSLGVVSLGMWLADWGALMYVPQKIADSKISLLNINLVRFCIAIIFCLGLMFFPLDRGGVSHDFLVFAAPAVVIWSFNQAGYLDGINKSATGGVIYQINWALAAASSVLLPVSNAGFYKAVGMAFSFGTLSIVFFHYMVLWRSGCIVRKGNIKLCPDQAWSFLVFGFYNTASSGLGQIYGRFVQFGINSWISLDVGGFYSLGRNVLLASCQVVTMIRRVEFVRWAREKSGVLSGFGFWRLMRFYKFSNSISFILLFVSCALIFLVAIVRPSWPWYPVAVIYSVFPAWVLAGLLGQIYLFEFQDRIYLFGQVFGVLISVAIFLALYDLIGISSVAVGEISMFLFQAAFYYFKLQRNGPLRVG